MARILYITYDGLMEPLGMSQVWQYLKVLNNTNDITIVSFEKSIDVINKEKLTKLRNEIESYGVSWYCIKYHKFPSVIATLYDIAISILYCSYIISKKEIDIVHARSYVPALTGLMIKKIFGKKFIFDMRGFWADEKVDGGTWKKSSLIYKITKKLECSFFIHSDFIVSLTNVGSRDVLSTKCLQNTKKHIEVIPTCVNLKLFHINNSVFNRYKKIENVFTLGYVGSVGTFYLFDEVLKRFKALLSLNKKSKLLIINKGQHDFISESIFNAGINKDCVEIKSVEYGEVANEINKMDAGIFYIKPVFSKRSSSPTKFGEFLGCGKPCVSNSDIGDTERILEVENVGIVLRGFADEDHAEGMKKLIHMAKDTSTSKRCIGTAHKYFSLDAGVSKYNKIYEYLTNN